MPPALCIESSSLAQELHALLQSIDPTRWRQDMEEAARARLVRIQCNLVRILETYKEAAASDDSQMARLYDRLQSLSTALEDLRQTRINWEALRQRLQPSYAALAATLEHLSVPTPSLRPTNYSRSLFHLGMGLFSLCLIQFVLNPRGLILASVPFALFCWTIEILRVRYKSITPFFMLFMSRVAHPHEHHKANSATWYASALALLALTVTPLVGSMAVIVLAVADPMAALVGRRWGRTPLHKGRTLEGSLTFVTAGVLASVAVLWAFYPALGLGTMLFVSLLASVAGALAELVSGRLDDNFTIPLAAGAGATAALAILGV